MKIILIFWNRPHLPLPTFLMRRWCSQVVEWGELSHWTARPHCVLIHTDAACRGSPPESCVWVPFALSESRGDQGKTPFVSQLLGSNQRRALGLRFSERQEKPFSKMRLSASSLFLGYRMHCDGWVGTSTCPLVSAFAVCFDGGLSWSDVAEPRGEALPGREATGFTWMLEQNLVSV